MKCTILGCGGSLGAPQLLCECVVCKSNNPKNKRMRASILVETPQTKILVDTGPDFKQQAFQFGIKDVNAVLYTHMHADHISGIDDFKPIPSQHGKLPAYMTEETFNAITGSYGYMFSTNSSVYRPHLEPNIIDPYAKFAVGDIEVQSFLQEHGEITSLGFRFGNIAYSTDCNGLSTKSLNLLKDLDLWVVDCLRYSWAPTHFTYEQTMRMIEKVQPKHAVLTHLSHEVDYDEFSRMLPSNIEVGYDGLSFEYKA
jgi:phosphoribosyl 1,2-cyclic phosphate phosphodiesterase